MLSIIGGLSTVLATGSNNSILNGLHTAFIKEKRYLLFADGLVNTLIISLLSVIIGVSIGLIITFLKLSKNNILRWIANVYTDIIRGTPIMTQLLIVYFVVFSGSHVNKLLIAAIAFGINSGAYVSEIVRAGILSVDKGQTEAGRSLGFTGSKTMRLIILPQAIKNILPALANEFITIIKETSIAGTIAVMDLTKATQAVTGATFSYTYPLLGSALIYYVLIKLLSTGFKYLEEGMRKSEAR